MTRNRILNKGRSDSRKMPGGTENELVFESKHPRNPGDTLYAGIPVTAHPKRTQNTPGNLRMQDKN